MSAKPSSAFNTTQWSVVLAVQHDNGELAHAALEKLCARYWPPVYAFVRGRGAGPHEAEDLTQSFFAFLLEKEALKRADRSRGRFRTFLLAALTNFLANKRDKQIAAKRGGRFSFIPLEDIQSEEACHPALAAKCPAERAFERRWATTLVNLVLAKLKREYESSDKLALYQTLHAGLTGEVKPGDHVEWAARLGLSEGAVRVALHRLRRRFGELVRSEIADTVLSPAEVNDEVRHLFAAISD